MRQTIPDFDLDGPPFRENETFRLRERITALEQRVRDLELELNRWKQQPSPTPWIPMTPWKPPYWCARSTGRCNTGCICSIPHN